MIMRLALNACPLPLESPYAPINDNLEEKQFLMAHSGIPETHFNFLLAFYHTLLSVHKTK